LQTKKRYCGMAYTSPEGPPFFDAKGIETIRRDQCLWTQRVVEDVLKTMFLKRDITKAKKTFVDHTRLLREGKVPLSELLFFRETRRREDYKVLPPHCYTTDRLIPGMRVPYGIERGAPRETLAQRARNPHKFRDPDFEYYIFKHAVASVQRCFGMLGEDVKLWASNYRPAPNLPKVFLRCKFARKAQKCAVCGTDQEKDLIKSLNLCFSCHENKPEKVWFGPLQPRRLALEESKVLAETCARCSLGAGIDECSNFTCELWAKRQLCAQELKIKRLVRGFD